MNNQVVSPQMQYPNQRTFPQLNAPFNNIVFVQGIEGAKAFQLPPNGRAILLDSENDEVFYIKIADDIGMCNLRIFDYTERIGTPEVRTDDLSQYVRKDELQNLIKSMLGGNDHEQTVSTVKSKSGKNNGNGNNGNNTPVTQKYNAD